MRHTGGELCRLTDRVWVYPYEEARDRPNLGYIRGDRWSLAVDAGHSADHVQGFYHDLEEAGLPLPALTALTHWHWDHTFAMHAAHGLCLANARTCSELRGFRDRLRREGTDFFLAMHETIRREYADGKPVIVTLPDLVFQGEMRLDAGHCPIRVFQAESPHTQDATLIEAEDGKALMLGDAASGEFPDWVIRDKAAARSLAETIRRAAPEICLPGHGSPMSPEEVIQGILEKL